MSDQEPAERKGDVRWITMLIGIATVFFSDVLLAGANFYFRDLVVYHFPMKRMVREALLSGQFPYWNRYLAGGQPMAANPAYEIFYPPQLLILTSSYEFGFALHILVHVYAALIGMYLLLRELKLRPAAAFLGAVSFGLGGLLLGSVSLLPTFFIWSLAPLLGWTVVRFIQSPGSRRFGVAALVAGLQMLVGEPMAIAQTWLLIVAGVLFVGAARPRWRAAAFTVAIAASGALVASVQLLPASAHLRDTVRSRGFAFDLVKDFSMPLIRPAELVIPHALGVPDPFGSPWWGMGIFARKPYLGSLYSGLFIAIFALAGLILRLPGARTTAALALLSYLLAIGDSTPLLRILYSIGIFRGFRYPEKLACFGVVAIVIFAASAADRFLSGDRRAWRAAMLAAGAVAAMSAAPAIWSQLPGFVSSFSRFFHLHELRPDLARAATLQWGIGLALALAVLGTIASFRTGVRRTPLLLAGLLLLIDLLLVGNELAPRSPRGMLQPPLIAAELTGDRRQFAVFHRGSWLGDDPNALRYRSDSRFWLDRNGMHPYTAGSWGFRSILELDFDETALLPTRDLIGTMQMLGNSGFARWSDPFVVLSNVGYVLDYRDYETDQRESGGEPLLSKPVEARRTHVQPRYFFATRQQLARSAAEANRFFVSNPEPFGVALVPFAPVSLAAGNVLVAAETGNGVVLDVEAEGRSFLVATVTRHRHWHATIDGHPAPILPANIAFQGLFVPAGKHRVEFRYRDPVVVWSGFISIAAIAAAMLMILRPRSRPLRSGS